MRSEIAWALWIAVGAIWELWCVFTEKRTGDEPLTRIFRDRLFKRSYMIKVGTIAFLGWWIVHWTVPGW